IRVKARGNWRRQKSNCKRPPFMLNFKQSNIGESSLFFGQKELKMVTPCINEKYVIREYLVYKLYNLVTDKSFRARLIRFTLKDENNKKSGDSYYGFLIENEDKMAERNQAQIVKRDGMRPQNTDKETFYNMTLFAYMIGNTDWGVEYRHNIKLIYSRENNFLATVPYDFDFTGIVGSPYAKPAVELEMSSVKERRYRGYCIDNIDILKPSFEYFKTLKEDFYTIINDCVWLEEKYRKNTLKFFDNFYKILDDPKKCEDEFLYPCDPRGTGNVIITGMKKN
ncbi:MAG: hypothetical protein R3250_17350, partial [Melioribacteraceae bacterium]|nr:hypothetical protein [Melioribacteraceae bacterium]